jgi:hypothetical protein
MRGCWSATFPAKPETAKQLFASLRVANLSEEQMAHSRV